MSCNSGIYVVNTATTTVAAGSAVPFTTIVRRFGNCLNLNNYGVQIKSPGYYEVTANITVVPTATGTVTATLYKDGVAVVGANTSAAGTAGENLSLALTGMARQGCCCGDPSVLTVVISAAGTVSNIGMVVTKV